MDIKNRIRSVVRGAFQSLSGKVSRASKPALAPPPPSQVTSKRPRDYDPKKHKNFYAVSTGILQAMLVDPSVQHTSKTLCAQIGFAGSTVRQTLRILAKDSILRCVVEYPATYNIRDEALARVKLAEFSRAIPDEQLVSSAN